MSPTTLPIKAKRHASAGDPVQVGNAPCQPLWRLSVPFPLFQGPRQGAERATSSDLALSTQWSSSPFLTYNPFSSQGSGCKKLKPAEGRGGGGTHSDTPRTNKHPLVAFQHRRKCYVTGRRPSQEDRCTRLVCKPRVQKQPTVSNCSYIREAARQRVGRGGLMETRRSFGVYERTLTSCTGPTRRHV